MSELTRLLRKKDRRRRPTGVATIGTLLLVALGAAGGGFYLGVTDRGAALWDEHFGPHLTWREPIDPATIDHDFDGALLSGRVTKVSDGDTVNVRLTTGQKFRIRLAEIDAPESCQPYGRESTRLLSRLVKDKKVKIVLVDADRYGRLVGRIFVDDIDVSAQLVAEGAAWFNDEYARDNSLFLLEEDARDQGRGLWQLPIDQRDEPWVFRDHKRC